MAAGRFHRLIDDLVELAVRVEARLRGRRFVAVADGDRVIVYRSLRGGAFEPFSPSGREAGRGAVSGELRLPADALLTRSLSFPSGAADVLEQILDGRLDRLTPWSPERVIYGYRAEKSGDAISVGFVAAARDAAEEWCARAKAANFVPTALGSASDPLDRPLAVDLWRGARDPARGRARRALAFGSLAASALLIAVAGLSYRSAIDGERRLAELDRRGEAARTALARADGTDREARLIAEKNPAASAMTLIDRIAKALPDGAVLRELEIAPDQVRLVGDASAAPELIGLLGGSGAVADARFAAPVARRDDGRDGFEIVASRTGTQSDRGQQ